MSIFITSDTFFNYELNIEYNQLPFDSVNAMNRYLIQKWNSIVGKEDIVYHLGNFGKGSIDYLKELLSRLNGRISIVRGKEDETANDLIEIGFNGIFDEITLNHKGNIIKFTHEPKLYYEYEDGVINIHGYEKSSVVFKKKFINVCAVNWEFEPQELDKLIIKYRRKINELDS